MGRLKVAETRITPQYRLIPPIATISLYSGTSTLSCGTIMMPTITARIRRFLRVVFRDRG